MPCSVRREGSRTADTTAGGVRPQGQRAVPRATSRSQEWHNHLSAGTRLEAPPFGARRLPRPWSMTARALSATRGRELRSFRPRSPGGHTTSPAGGVQRARERALEPRWLQRRPSPPPAPGNELPRLVGGLEPKWLRIGERYLENHDVSSNLVKLFFRG